MEINSYLQMSNRERQLDKLITVTLFMLKNFARRKRQKDV